MDATEIPGYEPGDRLIFPGGRGAEVLAVKQSPYADRAGTSTTLILITNTVPPEIKEAPDWMVRPTDRP